MAEMTCECSARIAELEARIEALVADRALALDAAFAQGQRAALEEGRAALRAVRFAAMNGRFPWTSIERLERLVGMRT